MTIVLFGFLTMVIGLFYGVLFGNRGKSRVMVRPPNSGGFMVNILGNPVFVFWTLGILITLFGIIA